MYEIFPVDKNLVDIKLNKTTKGGNYKRCHKLKKEYFMMVWFDFTGKYIKPNELIIRQIIIINK